MPEKWVELDEFPDYAVSEYGDVVNMRSDYPRKISINQQGIAKISLYKGKELHTRSVAVMVAEAFVEGQNEIFDTPIHLDGDRRNCRADNLMWRPRWMAIRYHKQFFHAPFHHASVAIQDLDSGAVFNSIKEACMTYGLYHGDVYRSITEGVSVPPTAQEFIQV